MTNSLTSTELTREHLEEVLKSDAFQRSPKLSRLLTRLVEPSLAGDSQSIKEQILGIEVFDRPANWNPQTDSIVRVHVNRLRQTLSIYYAGRSLPVRFEIPKGSYRVQCVPTSSPDSERSSAHEPNGPGAGRLADASRWVTSKHTSVHPREIRLQRLTYERGDLTNAAFCPDGESIVYSARWCGEPATIYSQRIRQKYSRPLGLPNGKLCDVSASGQLLFTLGEGPTGILATAELSGGPWREIVGGVSDAVWLAGKKNIAGARLEDGSMQVELPLGKPVHRLTGNQTDIRLKVDQTGRRIAFIDRSLGRVDFCVAEAGGQVQRISKGWRVAGGILWQSPDRLLLSGVRRGASAVYSLDLDGGEEPVYPTPITWNLYDRSETGRVLASCVDSRLHVAVRTSSMHCEARLSRLVNTRLVGLTPDSKFAVLMELLSHDGDQNSPILLVAIPDGEPVQIAEGYYPQVSPDGKEVICLERTESGAVIVVTPIPSGLPRRYPLDGGRKYHSTEFGGKPDRLLVHSLDELGNLHTNALDAQSSMLSPLPGQVYITLVSPNGNWGVVPGGSELRMAHLETGEIRSICGVHAGWSPVRWSSSGNELFIFEPDGFATGNLSRINILTGERNPWLTLHPADSVGAYILSWIDVTPDGRSYAYTYQQDLSDLYVLSGIS